MQAQFGQCRWQMLLDMLQPAGARLGDGAGRRFTRAGEQSQQGRFAAAVMADQADAVALAQSKGEFVEQETVMGIEL